MTNPHIRLLPALLAAGACLACTPSQADSPMAMDGAMPMHHGHDHHDMQATMAAALHAPVAQSTVNCQVPDVTLRNADGRPVPLRRVLAQDEPLMLNFIFTSCTTVCPVMSGIFSQVQTRLGKSVRLVSISIDPEFDTPDRLKAYGKRFNAGPEWTLLTGSRQDSIAVQRAFATYRGDKMEHTAATFIRAKPNQPWLRIDGLASADDLIHAYQRLAAR